MWICDCNEILEMLDFQSRAEKEVKGRIQRINGTIDNVVCICIDYEQSPIFPQGQQSEQNTSAHENQPTEKKVTRGGEREK